MKDYNKVLGCLIGGAAGDALGYAVEFDRENEIFARYGKKGITEYELEGGRAIFSDDTQMTLFCAAGLLLADIPEDYTSFILAQYQANLEWYGTQTAKKPRKVKTWLYDIPDLHVRRAPGITCMKSLGSRRMGSIYEPLNNSKGCGGVMRVAPVGLFYETSEKLGIKNIDLMAAGQAAITHDHMLGILPAAGLAHIVQMVSHNPEVSLLEAVEDMIPTVSGLYPDYEKDNIFFRSLMEKAVELASSDLPVLDCIHQLGEGWVGEEALAIAIYCALKFQDDFDACMIASVNHKGDSDSTGAIAGNILGAYLGYDRIPEKYKTNLEMTDVLERMAKELFEKM